jgi:hypothetical protein
MYLSTYKYIYKQIYLHAHLSCTVNGYKEINKERKVKNIEIRQIDMWLENR